VANKRYVVKLSDEERQRLSGLISKGKAAARTILKARILLKADESEAGECWTDPRICEALDTSTSTVMGVREKLRWRKDLMPFSRARSVRRRPSSRSSTASAKPS
jgi:hypothetical protein